MTGSYQPAVRVGLHDLLDGAAELIDNWGDTEDYRQGVLDVLALVLRDLANEDQQTDFQALIALAMTGRRA